MLLESEIKTLKEEIEKGVKDPRREWGNKRHRLEEIIIIALCSTLSCGEDFDDMEEFGKDREPWLRGFLELANGIPHGDTFRRVLERIESAALSGALNAWLEDVRGREGGRSINIDGKTMRGSGRGGGAARHVVSAWVDEKGVTLGEVAVEEKGNEIAAMAELLDMFDIRGDVVTIDAMGCQSAMAGKIHAKGGDYVLALKDNQATLHGEVASYFDWLERETPCGEDSEKWPGESEKGHGRIERREVTVASAHWLAADERKRWPGLRTLVRCRRLGERGGKATESVRHFISSCPMDAKAMAALVRGHWAIENGLHWTLDVVFGEDSAQASKGNSPLNMNVLRKTALSLLKPAVTPTRLSLRKKMMKAARDTAFLSALLNNSWPPLSKK